MTRLKLIGLVILLGAAAPAGNVDQGRAIVLHGMGNAVLPCMACHGAKLGGNRSIGAPALAGLPAATTTSALASIAAGTMGNNYVMKNIAMAMTPAQRSDVAAYLASLKP